MTLTHALLALAALTVPAVATASGAAAAPPSIVVEISDLDLGSDKGQRVLAARIQRAARTLCRADVLERLPQNLRAARKCIRTTRARAEAAVRTATATATAGPVPALGG